MPIARKPAHVGSGPGKDRGCRQVRYAKYGIQKRGEIAKGAAASGRLLIYPGDCRIHLAVSFIQGGSAKGRWRTRKKFAT